MIINVGGVMQVSWSSGLDIGLEIQMYWVQIMAELRTFLEHNSIINGSVNQPENENATISLYHSL